MKPTIVLASTRNADENTLALLEHDGHYYLQLDGTPLQSSFAHGAQSELARLACAPFRPVRQPRLLLAGLGLGFTLATAREALPQRRATFLVAEPCAELPAWHRRFLADLHPGQLGDPRVHLEPKDVAAVLDAQREGLHAILLDAGGTAPLPGVTDQSGVPVSSFLHRAHSTLKEGGLLAVACSNDSPSLERRLRQAGFDVAHQSVPASHKGKQKRRSSIWLARNRAAQN